MTSQLALVLSAFTAFAALSGCGGSAVPARATGAGPGPTDSAASTDSTANPVTASRPRARPKARPAPPSYPILLPAADGSVGPTLTPVVRWRGQTAAWIARTPSGVTLLSFDQRLVVLALHAGTVDPGGAGWRYGPAVIGAERDRLIAAFNGGFRLSTGAGGFMSAGRVAVPLRDGVGSIVTYADGTTDVGSWNGEVPRAGAAVQSVRQNLSLLIDHGVAASTIDCRHCWGATIGGRLDVARSALGVSADGRLVWAAGENLSVAALADALRGAGVVRAVELDVNPDWVVGYLYRQHAATTTATTTASPAASVTTPTATTASLAAATTAPSPPPGVVTAVPGQVGANGSFLAPYSRDFFAVTAR